jgi:hypothetical protein
MKSNGKKSKNERASDEKKGLGVDMNKIEGEVVNK